MKFRNRQISPLAPATTARRLWPIQSTGNLVARQSDRIVGCELALQLTVNRDLTTLVERGLLQVVGRGRSTRYVLTSPPAYLNIF